MLATMMLPGQVTMIPVFMIYRSLGWVNTFYCLIVPALLGNPFFIFMLRQFFRTIPADLMDAARIDGCSELRIWWQVVLPLCVPALATVGLFSFLGAWNDFIGPLIYLLDENKYTMSLGLAMFKGQYGSQFGQLMAVSAMMTVPIVVLFFFTQRTFIQGVKLTGLKG
jgi:multiple sugar transport system permease protein